MSLFGKFWCVAYRDDARDLSLTQMWFSNSVHEFEVPGILTWKWRYLLFFRGSLKKKLKEKNDRIDKAKEKILRKANEEARDILQKAKDAARRYS